MLLLLWIACTCNSPPAGPTLPIALWQSVCDDPCAGPGAKLAVFHDDAGEVGLVRYTGDLGLCSHTMTMWVRPDGEIALSFSDKPVTVEVAVENGAKITALEAQFTAAGELGCPPDTP